MRGSEHEGLGRIARRCCMPPEESEAGKASSTTRRARPPPAMCAPPPPRPPSGLAEEPAGIGAALNSKPTSTFLETCEMREDGKKRWKERCRARSGLGRQRLAVDGDAPPCRPLGAKEQAEEVCSLPQPDGPHQRDERARPNLEVDVLRARLAVIRALPQMLDGDRAHALAAQPKRPLAQAGRAGQSMAKARKVIQAT
jgi:hypothetical protein